MSDFFLTAILCTTCRHINKEYKSIAIGMRAGDPVKRFGRADKARQLAGRADAPRELFSSRRSFCAMCCQYGWAWFQLHLRDEYARASIHAWRPLLSMRIRSSSSPQLVLRPVAMPNPRRSRAQKTVAPTCEKGVRCAPPTPSDLPLEPLTRSISHMK